MKKKVFLILLLLGLILLPVRDVFAVDDENEGTEGNGTTTGTGTETTTPSWPKAFTHDDFAYSIEGIVLNVYEINKTTDENGKVTTSEEDVQNYLKNKPKRVVTLDPEKFTIEPTYKEEKFYRKDATYIGLGLNLTDEDVKDLLSTEIAATNKNKAYMVEMEVQYKLTDFPDKYKNVFGVNTLKEIMNMEDLDSSIKPLDLSKINSQVIYYYIIQFNEKTNKVECAYETHASDDNTAAAAILNYQVLSNKDSLKVLTASEDEDDSYIFVFHVVDNIDYVIDNFKKIVEYADSYWEDTYGEIEKEKDQKVEVPNTAKNFPLYLYAFGMIVMLSGFGIVMQAVQKEQKVRVEED